MKTLAIETSCDETSVAVLGPQGEVLVNWVSSQVAVHAPYLGVVPELAARHHVEVLPRLLRGLEREGYLQGVELVVVTQGPGLIGSLLVGTTLAAAFAYARKLPLVTVDHLEGHLVSPFMNLTGEPADPIPERALTLVVSGGHSSYFLFAQGKGVPLNRTRDDAAGEVFDKVAAALGLGYPGGPVVDRWAELGDPDAFSFAPPRIKDPLGELDFSFSGLKTAVIRQAQQLGLTPLPDPTAPPQAALDLLASFRATVVRWLLAPLGTLHQRYHPPVVAAAGGVAANRLLRQELQRWGAATGVPVRVPPLALTTDNAAMIGRAGQLRAQVGAFADPLNVEPYPRVSWKGSGEPGTGKRLFPPLATP
ncbi:MAG: tRNA (adenosine(37)-N6)-threonylcarbamoyltransferase complex transferase subunit TsaD [Thermoanaerobaculum sp.]|nr:tRNA (adenosine(37)-N6)-threonylcarbamoyltransferase complex transferase subunit TsaD [Thermoanaerobaculum sp.]MDW7968108.1 tRNA (adenosine(37)-N6)-threonylcarbamoyltransferase complex transferase subunit TsaD [Thermoanaerobaculum sp.]